VRAGNRPPPIGSCRISYTRFLHLLKNRMIKRITFFEDGHAALLDIPISQGGHDYRTQRYYSKRLDTLYCKELPEWQIEVLRFYVDIPGDFWLKSGFYKTVHNSLPHRTRDGCASQ
jgi:hypothetical protein